MQAPDPWPGKEEVKHDCFQPQLKGYDGEYGRPHEAECQKCISIAYSIERLNEFGYKVSRCLRGKWGMKHITCDIRFSQVASRAYQHKMDVASLTFL